MAYDIRDPFIIPTLVEEHVGAVKDIWGGHESMGLYLLSHWSKVFLSVVSHFQKDSYQNYSNNEDIVSCEWEKDLFVNSSDTALIKGWRIIVRQ